MDLIAGLVVVSSVFMVATAVVAHPLISSPPKENDDGEVAERKVQRRAKSALIPLLIGFFVGIADILVTAQLPAVAFVNLIIGAGVVAIVYDVSKPRRHGSSDTEGWQS
jgi:hypothetical protein